MTPYPGKSIHDVEWAIEIFRPLLKELHIQYVDAKAKPCCIQAARYRTLVINGMARCLVAIQAQSIPNGKKGYTTSIYNKKRDLFIFSIVLNEDLYQSDDVELRMQRKALAIHEFVHCVAAMLSVSVLGKGPSILINQLKERLKEKLVVTASDDFERLIAALGIVKKDEQNKDIPLPLFNDKHFRIGFEDFQDDYADLYLNFLFSYRLLLDMLPKDWIAQLKNLIKTNSIKDLAEFFNILIQRLREEKAIGEKFAIQRMRSFIPRLIKEFLLTAK
ncbi:hypothetical protein [Treponema sp.]|uniref:hypothetical protein n=1 Tax=Treponema sp. TaxID=166 RepID=UPI003FA1F905